MSEDEADPSEFSAECRAIIKILDRMTARLDRMEILLAEITAEIERALHP